MQHVHRYAVLTETFYFHLLVQVKDMDKCANIVSIYTFFAIRRQTNRIRCVSKNVILTVLKKLCIYTTLDNRPWSLKCFVFMYLCSDVAVI